MVDQWFTALQRDETARLTWLLLDQPLRLALVQAWMLNQVRAGNLDLARRDRDDLAHALAPRDASHPLFEAMITDQITHWRRVYADICDEGGIRSDTGVLHADRPVGPDLELLVLPLPGEAYGEVTTDRLVRAHNLVTRFIGNAWIIAALSRGLPVPGWPPTEYDVDQAD